MAVFMSGHRGGRAVFRLHSAIFLALLLLALPQTARAEIGPDMGGEAEDSGANEDLRPDSELQENVTRQQIRHQIRHVLLAKRWWQRRRICRWHNRARARRCRALARRHKARYRRLRKRRRYRHQRRYRTARRKSKRPCFRRCRPARAPVPAGYTKQVARQIGNYNEDGRYIGRIKLFAGEKMWGPPVLIQSCYGDNILTRFSVNDAGTTGKTWFQYEMSSKKGAQNRSRKWVMVEPGMMIKGRYIRLRVQSSVGSDIVALRVVGSCINQ